MHRTSPILTETTSLTTKLSPQQIMVIRMIELPNAKLEERILEEMQENIAIELDKEQPEKEANDFDDYDSNTSQDAEEAYEGDGWGEDDSYTAPNDERNFDEAFDSGVFDGDYDNDYDGGGATDDTPNYKLRLQNQSADDEEVDIPFTSEATFREYLSEQLGHLHLSEQQQKLGNYIINAIDDNGYLNRSPEQLVDDMLFSGEPEYDGIDQAMEHMLAVVQTLEPAGVGARSVKECLLLQLQRMGQNELTSTASTIINRCFTELSKRHFDKIRQRLNLSEQQLKDAVHLIQHLNPKPGSSFASINGETKMNHLTADFILLRDGDQLMITLNNADIPPVRISKSCISDLASLTQTKEIAKRNKAGVQYIRQKVEECKLFIDAIRQRNETLIATVRAIVHYQRDFFFSGDDALIRPMILQNIADRTGYDVSTISRVNNEKYIKTEFGTFPLKHFFSESIEPHEGDEQNSTRKIKKVLREVIDAEDKHNPLSDDQLVEIMQQKNCPVARRTIAKYRQQLDIPVARLRKQA